VRQGAYWGVGTNIGNYGLSDPLDCPFARTLAAIPARLKRLAACDQERLVNRGNRVCDAALRRHVDPSLPRLRVVMPPSGTLKP
jgi:NTE family protein